MRQAITDSSSCSVPLSNVVFHHTHLQSDNAQVPIGQGHMDTREKIDSWSADGDTLGNGNVGKSVVSSNEDASNEAGPTLFLIVEHNQLSQSSRFNSRQEEHRTIKQACWMVIVNDNL
ncbi:hypothetical protein PHLCEN_2v4814 [Hermanssonia centrifuga]|uniref:Uncharacterized protein n=1 Tax=Hermanssonia centrifuga TaxID=98765 RepID=A0A2R6PGI4_9APHY|nr:hypothetical protein PHLCEN_2v4814 [Hermanssonia centrifuga]